MAKGNAALTYLPAVEIVVASGDTYSVEALKAGLYKVAQMQSEGTVDGTYTAVPCGMSNPYSTCTWDIVVADADVAGDYQLTFNAESNSLSGDSINRTALSTRRAIDFGLAANTNEFTVRSVIAVINFIEKLEDKVASTGVGSTGDATYTDVSCKGFTPYETFNWTVTKLGNVYTVVSTATS